MRRLGIIQPGRLGDIIICLPIAKWYSDRGYEIIWPIERSYVRNFAGYVDYVNFVGIDSLDCNAARKECVPNCNTVLDLSITFPNSHPYNDSMFYQNRDKRTFDQIKYEFANVPFAEKWNLTFRRDIEAEQQLENKIRNSAEPFTLAHTKGSSEEFNYRPEVNESVIYVNDITPSIFDWCGLIEKANKVVALESCFATLVEQTDLFKGSEKIFVPRQADVRAFYVSDWKVFDNKLC